MREKDINGKYIGNAIGFCHCPRHEGALNHDLGYEHKCIAKRCKYLEKYNEKAWERHVYHNVNKGGSRKKHVL